MLARSWDRNSVRLSVTHMLCGETKDTADDSIPHETVITPVFWYQQKLVSDVSFYLKFALKVTHPFENADVDLYLFITSES